MTRVLKWGRQRATLCRSKKIHTEIYHHLSRVDVTLIIGIAPYQAGIMLRFPPRFSHAILMLKWSRLGMELPDALDDLRWRYRAWRDEA